MFSAKHILEENEDETRYRIASSQAIQFDRETPPAENRTWNKLWDEILGSNITADDSALDLDLDGEWGNGFNNVNRGIETWAAKSLQSLQNQCPTETLIDNVQQKDASLTCYGMIHRVLVRMEGNMSEIVSKLSTSSRSCSNEHYTFKFGIERSSDNYVLQFQDGSFFGILNTHHNKALEDLTIRPSIIMDALGSKLTIKEVIERAEKASQTQVRVDINVYGPKDEAKDVGEHLSSYNVYLQRPDQKRRGSVYENPQALQFPGWQISGPKHDLEEASQRPLSNDAAHNFQETVTSFYKSLTRGTKLSSIEGNYRLKTELFQYQKQALDFMTQRENGPIPPEFCLWKPEGEGWFRHSVTRTRSRAPSPETGGGILADEMGMGKTLSMLALITTTLESANHWATQGVTAPLSDVQNKRRSQATLVVVPSVMLINQWLDEINIHLIGTIKALKYHGQSRRGLSLYLENVDIVITTYHTLVADFGNRPRSPSPLHNIQWFRVLLDEAHTIRRQQTTFYQAVIELKARSRWCLTGTPIQNRLDDLGALLAFIGVRPFHNTSMFRRYVSIPFYENEGRRAVATQNLISLLESLCLRRSKMLLHLPEPQQRFRTIEFSKEERDQYENTKGTMNRALRERVSEAHNQSTFGMFQIQLQLRLLCNHGTYQHPFSWARRNLLDEKEDALCSISGSGQVTCSACRQSMPILGSNNIYRRYAENCAHILCSECLVEVEEEGGLGENEIARCPLCTLSGVSSPSTIHHSKGDTYLLSEGRSSKMEALINDIREDLWKTKSIVFSCWTNTLNLVQRHLLQGSIPFARIDGETPLSRRQKILNEFSGPSSETPVLIMTTGTGALGLNLPCANRVFMIEPQWNPSVENQAIARAIRINQQNSVLVTRYMIKGTVEQEILSQQEWKRKIAGIGNTVQLAED